MNTSLNIINLNMCSFYQSARQETLKANKILYFEWEHTIRHKIIRQKVNRKLQ